MQIHYVVCLTLDPSELADLLVKLHGLKDWKRLALKLGFTYDTIKKMKEGSEDKEDDCIMEVMHTWLLKGSSSTRQALIQALEAVQESAVAARIRGGKE